jgi:D-alanine-D-alanine ligase
VSGRQVGLLFGGRSVEHEVSVVSARGVDRAMAGTSLTCVPLGVTGDGRWLSPEASRRVLDGRAARVEPSADDDDGVRVLLDPGGAGLLLQAQRGATRPLAIDVLFPLVHGWGGEDGRLQGALELAGVPYVGAGPLASAAGMDKAVAKEIFAAHGIEVVPWILVTRAERAASPERTREHIADEIGFPAFVKPANGGSSVGVSKARESAELDPALDLALRHDRRVVVERGVDAREIECAVLGNDEPQASGLGEIAPSREFYDYEAKYVDAGSKLTIPAALPPADAERIRELAIRGYRALDLCGFSRVDFLVDRGTLTPYLNEVNTLPGFTPISMFPKLWEAAGLPFGRLVERLVDLGIERARETSDRASRWDGR